MTLLIIIAVFALLFFALAFVFGFSMAALLNLVLKPVGRFFQRLRLLLPLCLLATAVASFLLVMNDVFHEEWAVATVFVGVIAFCGLLTWLLFDVILKRPTNNSNKKDL